MATASSSDDVPDISDCTEVTEVWTIERQGVSDGDVDGM